MKKLIGFILISVLFISVVSIGDNEVHAEKFKWGKVTIDDETSWGKVQIKKNTSVYKKSGKNFVKVKNKTLKKGEEYGVFKVLYNKKINKKKVNLIKLYGNSYVIKNKNVKYLILTPEVRNKLVGNGTLQGSITWQYNKFIGTKPDINAHIIAFPKQYFSQTRIDYLALSSTSPSYAKNAGFFSTTVNGFGNYTLPLPSGKYYILIKSHNTTRNSNESIDNYVKSIMKKNVVDFTTNSNIYDFGLNNYNHDIWEIEIKKGEIIDISKDWGYTYF